MKHNNYYSNLFDLFSINRSDNIGSDIVAFSLPNSVSATNLSPPVQIKFEHAYVSYLIYLDVFSITYIYYLKSVKNWFKIKFAKSD